MQCIVVFMGGMRPFYKILDLVGLFYSKHKYIKPISVIKAHIDLKINKDDAIFLTV